MIVVDTSVWVAALRSATSRESRELEEVLDRDEAALPVIVRLEILSGASSRDRVRMRRALSALPVYIPRQQTWDMIESWIEEAWQARQRFGIADLLVAALAREHDATLWSLDRDFERMARLGFVRVHQPA